MNALIQLCEILVAIIKRLDLIDLPFLVLAVATQQPAFIALALLQFGGRRWPPVCVGLLQWCRVEVVEPWHCKVLPGAKGYVGENILSSGADEEDEDPIVVAPLQPESATIESGRNVIAIDSNERNALLFAGKADALAAMVHAGLVKQTDGIKIVYGVGPSSTNKTYLTAREMLHARLARLAPEKYRELDEDLQPKALP